MADQPLIAWLLVSTWADYKGKSGAKLESRIDLVSFAFDLTAAAVANIEDDKVRENIEKELAIIEEEVNVLRYNYEYILDNPTSHEGDPASLDRKHNEMEEMMSKITQKLLSMQINQQIVDNRTIRDFYMLRRHNNHEETEYE
jgi:hypothetical protein